MVGTNNKVNVRDIYFLPNGNQAQTPGIRDNGRTCNHMEGNDRVMVTDGPSLTCRLHPHG